jgi:hypothetical protein
VSAFGEDSLELIGAERLLKQLHRSRARASLTCRLAPFAACAASA